MQRYIHLNAHPYLYSYPKEAHRIKNLVERAHRFISL